MSRPIFYDPERRRWKRLRLITDPLGILLTALIVFFVVSLIRTENLTSLSLPDITVDAMESWCSAWTQDGVLPSQVMNRSCIYKE